MSKLEVYLFAPFRVLVDGKPISNATWQGRIPRSLLKILALSPRGKSADELIELFWPDQPLERARQRLYEAMSRLRRALCQQTAGLTSEQTSAWPIVTLDSGYRLADSTWVDVRCFHRHVAAVCQLRVTDPAAALDLLRGEQIDPDDLLSEEAYTDWALTARERVYEEARLLEKIRAELLIQNGRKAEALDALTYVLKIDPTCEKTARQAMNVAVEIGDGMRARAIFNRLHTALTEEVGVEPSTETWALHQEIAMVASVGNPSGSLATFETHEPSYRGTPSSVEESILLGHPPVFLTSFIGRERELAEIRDTLATTRLMTLQGAGGTGKTRLALEAVTILQENYKDGVCWIDLTSVREGWLLPQVVVAALGVREEPNRPLMETICDVLEPFSMLLVLDNCEYLLEDVSYIVQTLLRTCIGLSIIGTSRAALGISGEVIYHVPSLSLPDPDSRILAGNLAEYEAVGLFMERSTAVRKSFRLTSENAKYVAHICRRLDGIPLAIELAATKIGTLTPMQIADRLDRRFELLRTERSLGPARHHSLQALVDWSYNVLPDPERELWEQMSVFSGSFSLETVKAMCRPEMGLPIDAILYETVAGLVDRSIFVAEELDGVMRYRLLETLREYGLLKLQMSGREREMRQKHLHWCLDMVGEGIKVYCRHDESGWMRRLATEYDEIRAALDWALSQKEDDSTLLLVGSLWWFWMVQGRTEEGRTYVERALAAAGDRCDAVYAMALHAAGPLNLWFGEVEIAKDRLFESLQLLTAGGEPEQLALVHLSLGLALVADGDKEGAKDALCTSLSLARQVTDESSIAPALCHLGNIALQQGDLTGAKAYFLESLSLSRTMGYQRGEAGCLGGLGIIAYQEQHEHLAARMLQEAVTLCRDLNDYFFGALLLDYLGWMARRQGDYEQAHALHIESLHLRWTANGRTGIAETLGHLAETAIGQGAYRRAARLFAARESWRPAAGASLLPASVLTLDHSEAIAQLEAAIGTTAMQAVWQEGHLMRPEEIVNYALGSSHVTDFDVE